MRTSIIHSPLYVFLLKVRENAFGGWARFMCSNPEEISLPQIIISSYRNPPEYPTSGNPLSATPSSRNGKRLLFTPDGLSRSKRGWVNNLWNATLPLNQHHLLVFLNDTPRFIKSNPLLRVCLRCSHI